MKKFKLEYFSFKTNFKHNWALRNFVEDTKMCGEVTMRKGWDASQRDLDRLQ